MLKIWYLNFIYSRPRFVIYDFGPNKLRKVALQKRESILNWFTSLYLAINLSPSFIPLRQLEISEESVANMFCII